MDAHHRHHRTWDEADRRKWQDPESILTEIGLKPGHTFMDIGCGDGYFTLPAARMVGESGRVYGVDVNRETISRIENKAGQSGINNIMIKAAKAEDTLFCQACADIIFFGIVLHDFADPAVVLANARKMIKPTGLLVNLDWKKEPMEHGPPLSIRFSEDQARRLIESQGFRVESILPQGNRHYLIRARPL